MALPTQELQPQKQYEGRIQETPPPGTQNDPLIAKGLQKGQYLGIFAFVIALIAVIGYFSRRVEYAILFAVTLSVILIVFFLTL
ncbi:hypothetical protein DP113_03020 [Brasilonema octagenarum UFV-E1]|uniref:Uncharacterized protein n=2 Tax=Brasilonema TaxID=383614 RepID=A0A856M7B6_9CYAN|nr:MULTISPECIES: hypothetical protein [Brasilonema]NMF66998.1 hypothetical protein [Brasilonema octagenarum UFV-OR1]QDL07025.1 hypothetical protein DP114_03065 [Brasilonema sennae CENA114]QDL13387.1 hypothetical protein DP113_03020 [Brasilonema octagenarum UFV-E1]